MTDTQVISKAEPKAKPKAKPKASNAKPDFKYGREPKWSVEEIIKAVHDCKGNAKCVKERLAVRYETVMNYRRRYPTVDLAFQEERHMMIDVAEDGLQHHLEAEQPWAIRFTLSTVGKDRGYTERREVTGAGGGDVIIKITGNVDTGRL